MSAKILDGRVLASQIKEELKAEVQALRQKTGVSPHVVNIIMGADPGACVYAKSQRKTAEEIGINYQLETLGDSVTEKEVIGCIQRLNQDNAVHGIMIHKPVPKHIDYSYIANFVSTEKDLEGINVANIGKMILNQSRMIPCTPAAVMAHIHSTGINLYGKDAVIIGHSEIVGKPLSLLLLGEMATVTICHIATTESGHLEEHISRAEILIVAVGKAGLIKGRWIKEGAIVIDVGINRVKKGVVGDVEFATAKEKAAFITPVPGGVGPVTVVMLMKNALETFKLQLNISS